MTSDERYLKYINRILSHEGGYVNHPRDPGGETNWGIAKRSHPRVDIKNLTRDGAIAIYKEEYWRWVFNLGLPEALEFQVLDASINHGLHHAISFLQRALDVPDDGSFGPVSKAAMAKYPGRDDVYMLGVMFNEERGRFYTRLGTFTSFGRGWINRLLDNLAYLREDTGN